MLLLATVYLIPVVILYAILAAVGLDTAVTSFRMTSSIAHKYTDNQLKGILILAPWFWPSAVIQQIMEDLN